MLGRFSQICEDSQAKHFNVPFDVSLLLFCHLYIVLTDMLIGSVIISYGLPDKNLFSIFGRLHHEHG